MNKSEIAIIIPIRMDSTRLPGKFHRLIGDKTMIQHVYEKAVGTGVSHVYIAVDHMEHYELVKQFGGIPIITATTHQSGTDRVHEALQKIENNHTIKYVVNLQGDVPFINPDSILETIALLYDEDVHIATLATEIKDEEEIHDPNVVKIAMNHKNHALYFSRSAIPYNASKYFHHLGVYAFKRDALTKFINLSMSNLEKIEKLEQLRALENKMVIAVKEINETPISVDVESDLVKAIKFYNDNIKVNNEI